MVWQQSEAQRATRPSWLQASVTELEQRLQAVLSANTDGNSTFAVRAEDYYHMRPQLISLVEDLYAQYISLVDRYTQALLKAPNKNNRDDDASSVTPCGRSHNRRSNKSVDSMQVFSDTSNDPARTFCSATFSMSPPRASAASTSHSFRRHSESSSSGKDIEDLQQQQPRQASHAASADALRDELLNQGFRRSESARKSELQASLIEVMEEERVLMERQNERLASAAKAAAEKNQEVAAEVGRMQWKVDELARRIVKLKESNRESHRRQLEKSELARRLTAELRQVKTENRRLREALASTPAGATAVAAASVDATKAMRKKKAKDICPGPVGWGCKILKKMEKWITCGAL